jgi:hypothetical protein
MKHVTRPPFRKIAEHQIATHLGDLDASVQDELATSLVRQWLTNDGHAGLVMPTHQFWFTLAANGEGFNVGVARFDGCWGRALSRDWHVADEEIPGLLHQLNLCQSVSCRTTAGLTIRLRIEPRVRTVRCEQQAEGEE